MSKRFLNWFLSLAIVGMTLSLKSQHIYDQGFELLENQQYDEAETYFAEEIRKMPDNITANICYGRAIGLGGQPKLGLSHFKILDQQFPQDYEVDLNLAEAFMWNQDFENAQKLYWTLLQRDPSNFVANYGYANAQASLGNYEDAIHFNQEALDIDPESESAFNAKKYIYLGKAYQHFQKREFILAQEYLDSVLTNYPEDPDAILIQGQIDEKLKSYISINGMRSSDDQNETYSLGINTKIYISPKIDFKSSLIYSQFQFLPEGIATNQKIFNLGAEYHFSKNIDLEVFSGLNIVNEEDSKFAINNIYSLELKLRPTKIQNLSLKYNNEVYNYSALILRRDIKLDHYTITHHIQLGAKLGLYSNLIYTDFSDGNHRKFLFNSFYCNVIDKKLKVGINYATFKYGQDKSNVYFSPTSYYSYEFFTRIEDRVGNSPFRYVLDLSFGQQNISNSSWRFSRRIEAKLNYKLNQKVTISLHYLNSNVAQSLNIGEYNFSRAGISVVRDFR